MPPTAVRTTASPNVAAKAKPLPPARAFAKPARAAGTKFVRVGGKQSRDEKKRFALPKEFRRTAANHYSAVSSFAAQTNATSAEQSIAIDLHPFANAVRERDATPDITGARKRASAAIQLAQLPTHGPVNPPAVPLHPRVGRVTTKHELKRQELISINSTGAPLPVAVRNPLARTFAVDLTPIRVHTDASAQRVVKSLSTRAFAYGNHIFLGPGEQPTDLRVMAHEVAHVVQQAGGVTLQHFTPSMGDAHEHEAEQASAAALRGERFNVQQRTSPRVQGLSLKDIGIDVELPDPLDWLAGKANMIPGFRMFTIVLGVNPINMSAVDRSAANILRALIEFLPGGGLITQALDNSGVFEKAGAFVEQQIASLGMTGDAIKSAVTEFIARLSLKRILLEPGTVWEEAKSIFTVPIDRIISFAKGLVNGIIDLIKDAILKPIAKLAEGTEGYNLLKGILGKDPITGEEVPRTAETLLGPLLKMIGLGDVWQKMQDAKAIPRAWAWFQTTMSQLVGFVSQIPTLFISAFKSLTIEDIILVPKAFAKLAAVFGGFMGKFVSWGLDAMFKLLEIVFDVVSPGAFDYVKKTGAALKAILQNPLPFVGNLVKAAKLGFTNFAANILTHLKKGLIDWLTGSLEGVYIPTALTLVEFGKMAISILGVSWAQIRGKIVKALGPNGEMIMKGLETAFDVVKALITGGPKAAWEVIKDKLTDLKDTLVQGIIDFVKESIVTKAVPKLIAMFIPGAGFISAIISIYDTIMVFVEKISKIIQVVTAFINSIVAIAAGNIGAAAAKVESILGGLLSLAISFLAGFVGLGKVTSKIMDVVKKVRATVDKAIETAVNWIIGKAKSLFSFLFGKGKEALESLFEWWKNKAPFSDKKGQSHKLFFSGAGSGARLKVASAEMFTEEFLARVEKVMADDPVARSFAGPYVGQCKAKKAEIDSLKTKLEGEKKIKAPSAKFTDEKLKGAMAGMAAIMGPLFDVLPENAVGDLPVKPGDAVTMPYKGTERKAEILFASLERVNYEFKYNLVKTNLPTPQFKAKWKAGEIRPYVEKGARETYLGATPGKASATGKAVIKRYNVKTESDVVLVLLKPPNGWHPLNDCDMSHEPVDAVTFWNNTARPAGWIPKGPEVRAWMLNPANYILESSSANRSRGAREKGAKYLPP